MRTGFPDSGQPVRLILSALLVAAIGTGVGGSAALGQSAALSLQDGAFNEAQAVRGQALYYQHCLNCHGESMGGVDKAPPLAGPQFGSTWQDAPLAALHARILTMPPDQPDSLSPQEAVDILSYILWYNGLPLGELELEADAGVLSQLLFKVPVPGQ